MSEFKVIKIDSEKYENMLKDNTPYNVPDRIGLDCELMEKTNLALIFVFENGAKCIVSSTSFSSSGGCEDMYLANSLENKDFELFLAEIGVKN